MSCGGPSSPLCLQEEVDRMNRSADSPSSTFLHRSCSRSSSRKISHHNLAQPMGIEVPKVERKMKPTRKMCPRQIPAAKFRVLTRIEMEEAKEKGEATKQLDASSTSPNLSSSSSTDSFPSSSTDSNNVVNSSANPNPNPNKHARTDPSSGSSHNKKKKKKREELEEEEEKQ